jgi:uncharacterized membrane protein YjjP (DUF1212 family)
MALTITPAMHNAVQVAAAAIPGAIATAMLNGGGNGYMASALFASCILSAVSQVLHFNAATQNVVANLPAIVALLGKNATLQPQDVVKTESEK